MGRYGRTRALSWEITANTWIYVYEYKCDFLPLLTTQQRTFRVRQSFYIGVGPTKKGSKKLDLWLTLCWDTCETKTCSRFVHLFYGPRAIIIFVTYFQFIVKKYFILLIFLRGDKHVLFDTLHKAWKEINRVV